MTTKQDLTDRQRGYARYLVKLPLAKRGEILAAMRPALREKMRGFIRDAWADQVAAFHPDIKRLYLERLRNENRLEYNALLPQVVAREAVTEGVAV